MKSFLVWIEKKSETETISCENTHTHTFITCIHMTLFIWFNLVFYIHSRVMCCACATSKRIFVHFVFHSVHCLMLLLFQFCYSKCCFYAVNSTPTGYIFIEYKSYEKKHGGKEEGKKLHNQISKHQSLLCKSLQSQNLFLCCSCLCWFNYSFSMK